MSPQRYRPPPLTATRATLDAFQWYSIAVASPVHGLLEGEYRFARDYDHVLDEQQRRVTDPALAMELLVAMRRADQDASRAARAAAERTTSTGAR